MWSDLNTASKILRARLALTNRVDICVLDRTVAESPANLNDHPGRIFCYFGARPTGFPFLLVFGRSGPAADISHGFGFYVNSKFRIIQKPERKRFENKLQKGARLGLEIKCGVVSVLADVPKQCYLSILIQMGEFLLHEDLMTHFATEKRITNCTFSSFVCFNPTIPFPSCRVMELDGDARKVWDMITERKLNIVNFDVNNPPARLPFRFDVIKILFQDHILYGVHYRFCETIMIILTHPSLFQCREDADDVISTIKQVAKASRIELKHVGSTRFFSSPSTPCNSGSSLKALLLAFNLPLVAIKQCDTELIIPKDDDLASTVDEVMSVRLSQEAGPSVPYAPNWSDDEEILPIVRERYDRSEPDDPEEEPVIVSLDIDESNCEPIAPEPQRMSSDDDSELQVVDSDSDRTILTCSQRSSQRTIILSQSDIDNQLSAARNVRNIKSALQSDLPTVNVTPRDDPNHSILTDTSFFKHQLSHIVSNFGLPAISLPATVLSNLVCSLTDALSSEERLIIAPLQTSFGFVLLLVDKQTDEWGLLNPDVATQKDQSAFHRVKTAMQASASYFKSFGARQLSMPCHFHQKYKLMHLLLATYCICQAFKYARILPLRVAYTEKRLRRFCHSVCHALQEANRKYNEDHGLVRRNNFLEPGAFRSMPCPLVFEQSVVATDRCIFCEKRYHKNLGSHMAMAHGGQAAAKLRRRRWMESL